MSNPEKIYHSFRTFIADNFYVTTKLIFCLETKGRICFFGKNKNTNSNNEIIKIPQKETNDRKYIRSIGSEVMQMQFKAEKMPLDKRDNYIMDKLNIMEQNI